jgi:catechol 2,3-dioxygenase-like lactoylglutathione lyase family enzyme
MQTTARFGTRDLERAGVFYDAIAALIGAARVMTRPELIAYRGSEGGMFLIGKPFAGDATAGNGTQIGLTAPSRAVVDAVHAKALEMGGTCEGKPGIRGDDPDGYYGAYFRDPDGNKMTIFRFGPPDSDV